MHSVLFIGHEASRTGAPISLLNTVRELASRGEACKVILMRGGPLVDDYTDICETMVVRNIGQKSLLPQSSSIVVREMRRITSYVFSVGGWFIGWPRVRMLLKGITASTVDCAYLNSAVSCSMILRMKMLNIPVITHIHELQFGFLQSGHPDDLALMLSYSSRIIVPSKTVSDYLQMSHGVPIEKIVVLPEAVVDPLPLATKDAAVIRQEEGINPGEIVIAMAGTIDWRKGIDLFIALARRLAPLLPNARFMWIGAGAYHQAFMNTWKNLYGIDDALAQRFIFTGERTDVASLLSIIDIFALTSREDPCPLVHMEAAMLRKPVVCFAGTGGATEWVEKAGAGTVVGYQDTAAMADAIRNIISNPERRRLMGEAARRHMMEHCSLSSVVDGVQKVIDVVVHERA